MQTVKPDAMEPESAMRAHVEHLRERWLMSSPLPPPDSAPSGEMATPAAFMAAATWGAGQERGRGAGGAQIWSLQSVANAGGWPCSLSSPLAL